MEKRGSPYHCSCSLGCWPNSDYYLCLPSLRMSKPPPPWRMSTENGGLDRNATHSLGFHLALQSVTSISLIYNRLSLSVSCGLVILPPLFQYSRPVERAYMYIGAWIDKGNFMWTLQRRNSFRTWMKLRHLVLSKVRRAQKELGYVLTHMVDKMLIT